MPSAAKPEGHDAQTVGRQKRKDSEGQQEMIDIQVQAPEVVTVE